MENHSFPGEYIVKAFGPGSQQFRAKVEACATGVVGTERVVVSERSTKTGRKVCVTLTLNADNVDEVIEVYDRLHEVDGLMLLL